MTDTDRFVFSRSGLFCVAMIAVIASWPMWVYQTQFVFSDTESYINGGRAIWLTIWDMIPDLSAAPATSEGGQPAEHSGNLTTDETGGSTVGRSFLYSMLVYAGYGLVGLWPLPVVQGVVTGLFALAFVDRHMLARPGVLIAGGIYVVFLTTLPWFVAFQMPDLYAAVPVLFAALLYARLDAFSLWQRTLFVVLAALAVSFHYGYPPLMFGAASIVLLVRLFEKRLKVWVLVAALVPVVFAPLVNLGASSVVLETASATPQRLPIVLARSLADGPAYWYLSEACPEAEHAMCEAFGDDIPESIGQLLWSDRGVKSLTADQVARIRAEEMTVIWEAYKAYPIAQTRSLFRNAVVQAVIFGTDNIQVGQFDHASSRMEFLPRGSKPYAALVSFDGLVTLATWAGIVLCFAVGLSGRVRREHAALLWISLAGLLINAAIFGGLSSPVERYQSRVIWILPMLAAMLLSASKSKRKDPDRNSADA